MKDLLSEMRACKSIEQCIELATMDAYGEYEEAAGWQACLETLFDAGKAVQVLGQPARLEGFDLVNDLSVVAVCRTGKKKAKVAIDSVEFADLSRAEALWLKAWKKWSHA